MPLLIDNRPAHYHAVAGLCRPCLSRSFLERQGLPTDCLSGRFSVTYGTPGNCNTEIEVLAIIEPYPFDALLPVSWLEARHIGAGEFTVSHIPCP
ncbi:hypothetical protein HYPSUDRAFT_49372 [Hypholoma sublateritium FD-334 SS-4]|uniref:Uncharacterized protein n=1 Tax=Hypholoma sublateritium (strain FD-334 SS-4) TaxID=945553 RepID=A0A0D2NYW8_HYPSF|nr:hypothetical protein HYPSUDRAFT_49765 [Hypholoma sublateritium FD-334 SS-4]KJA14210.1 hypothetical protein HYPSUDRAFT_49372 [Hypholoma sublateritium FD-334 SS-4]